MLSNEEIAEALHASRIVPVSVDNPHGPLGLEQLAAAVLQLNPAGTAGGPWVRRPIALEW